MQTMTSWCHQYICIGWVCHNKIADGPAIHVYCVAILPIFESKGVCSQLPLSMNKYGREVMTINLRSLALKAWRRVAFNSVKAAIVISYIYTGYCLLMSQIVINASGLVCAETLTPHKFIKCEGSWCSEIPFVYLHLYFQYDSVGCMWTPVTRSTKCKLWLTVACVAMFDKLWMLLYALLWLLCTTASGLTCCWILGRRVCAVLSGTISMYPNTGCDNGSHSPNIQTSFLVAHPLWFWSNKN